MGKCTVVQQRRMGFKRLKYCAFIFASVLGILLLCHFSSTGYYSFFSVTYDKYDYPFIKVELQGEQTPIAVRIGSRFPLSLNKEILNKVDKQKQGVIDWHNLNGEKYEIDSFLIPKMKIGDLTLKNITAIPTLEREDTSILGKFLGEEFNLLLDFPRSRIIACDTFSKLTTKHFTGNHWIRIPFEMDNGCLIFQVNTDFGIRKLAINTTSTLTHLRASFFPSGQSSVSSSCSLSDQKFGNIEFHAIDLPKGLDGIDGFIGMDFLKKHAVYLDHKHKIAYVEPPENYFEHVPVTFASRGSPTINVSIEGNTYPLELDLGSSFPFSLCENILQNIRKISYGTAEWSDFRGQRYESPAYAIPKINIGNLAFDNMIIRQNREDFHINATLGSAPLQPIGTIGLPILEKYNLFLDFQHFAIYASNNYSALQQAGLLSNNFLIIPFTLHRDGILLSVETDMGVYRLILDTGATHTVIRQPHSNSTMQFRLMGHDFGSRSIVPIDLSAQFDFDGCLGLDFLLEHPLFIDYTNRQILLDLQYGKNKESSKAGFEVDEAAQV